MTTFRKNVLTIPLGRRVCVKTEYVLGWCSMPRALCPIPFNLICNMTTFRKKYFDLLTPPPGRGCVGVKYLPPCCFMRHPFNLIINMTIFWLVEFWPPPHPLSQPRGQNSVKILPIFKIKVDLYSTMLYLSVSFGGNRCILSKVINRKPKVRQKHK